jgi:beta-galactosidase
MRIITELNNDWNFHKGDIKIPRPVEKGPVYSQSKNERKLIGPAAYYYFDKPDAFYEEREMRSEGWKSVNLPHDYIINQDNDPTQNNAHGYFKYENAWYRKTIGIQNKGYEDKRLLLQFDGIAGQSVVYVNGRLVKRNYSAYNSFEVDITENVYFDKNNVIAVYVNTDEFEGWWYQGGGIYRDVRLVVTEKTAIDRYGVYAPYEKINETDWKINFETTLVNTDYEDKTAEVISYVIGKNGDVTASARAEAVLERCGKTTVKYSAIVNNPLLWSVNAPNLYQIKTELLLNGEVVDTDLTRIGFRTIELSAEKGFLINGEKTIIKGVNCHQDFGITGLAVPKNIYAYRIKLLKEMGCNGYRTSHYQHPADEMDLFDENGFVVMDETRWFETSEYALEMLDVLVKRDRNRPSVMFWSTGNEERTHITDMGKRIHRVLAERIRKLDKTRFITTCEDAKPLESTVFPYCDVIAVNYNLQCYDKLHEMYPDKLILSTESCATGTTRDWHFPDSPENGRIADIDKKTNSWYQGRENTWRFLAERPSYVIGTFQWAGIEHRGEAMWPRVCSVSGALDLFLQRKGAFYQNMSHWTDKPMVHIVPHWNFHGLEGEEILTAVYTNCEETELFLNGESLGKQDTSNFKRGQWYVKYTKGCLLAKGYIDGKEVCCDIRETTGKPVKLSLRLENRFEPNGKDIAVFTCECLDENGRTVPNAEEYVSFSTCENARILGTGSDICDHKNVTLPERQMYGGKITVALRPNPGAEEFKLFAKSKDCGTVCFTWKK